MPTDPRWQLLAQPVSAEAFARFVRVSPGYFLCGLHVESHADARINAGRELRLTLRGPDTVSLIARLFRDGRQLPEICTLVQREDERFVVRVTWPQAGTYALKLFAKTIGETGVYAGALEYRIDATGGTGERGGYPVVLASFYERRAQLLAPISHALIAQTPVTFDIILPGAADAVVINHGAWMHLTGHHDHFTAPVSLQPGEAQLCVQYPGQQQYEGVAQFVVE